MEFFLKDPDAVLWFGVDWRNRLGSGETIEDFEWVLPSGITKDDQQLSGTIAKIKLSGGAKYQHYNLTCRIVKSNGEREDQLLRIVVQST